MSAPVDNDDLPVHQMDETKKRGKPSAGRRFDKFRMKKNIQAATERTTAALKRLGIYEETFNAYEEQHQSGAPVKQVIPVTTRGIGLHSARFISEATNNLPRIEQPLKATENELYRFSLMQLARQLTLAEPGNTHSRALTNTDATRPRVSAFSCHTNGLFLADAINQVGNFTFESIDYTCIIPDEVIEYNHSVEIDEPGSPCYHPNSPDPRASPEKRRRVVHQDVGRITNPYFVTIFNLRDTVLRLSDPTVPRDVRAMWIKRNPIPGARFENDLLMNPDSIMPMEFGMYFRTKFMDDVNACKAMFNQVLPICPGSIGEVDMNGKGNELNLTAVNTNKALTFNVFNGQFVCEAESYMYATSRLPNITRLRGYVNLMNEMPWLASSTMMSSIYGRRDPNMAVNNFVESWNSLSWNVSPFRRN